MTVPDLRMPALGVAAWAGGLCAMVLPPVLLGAVPCAGLLWGWRRGSRAVLAGALVFTAVAAGAVLRQTQVDRDPVSALAAVGAAVDAELVVTSDPRPTRSGFGDGVVLRGTVVRVTGRGATHALRAPVLVLADESWSGVPLGARVHLTGRLGEPRQEGEPLSAVVSAAGEPEVVAAPDAWWRGAGAVRASLREAVAHRPAAQRALVPALVVGDDAGVAEELAEEFRTTGLTHLLAIEDTTDLDTLRNEV